MLKDTVSIREMFTPDTLVGNASTNAYSSASSRSISPPTKNAGNFY